MHSFPKYSLRSLFSATIVAAILFVAITPDGRVTALAFAIVAVSYLFASQVQPFAWIVVCGAWGVALGMLVGQTFEPGPVLFHFEPHPTRSHYSTTGAIIGL